MANDAMRHHWTTLTGPSWVEHAELYDRMLSAISDQVLASLTFAPGDRVLDVGCGTGTFSAAVASLGADVVGADISITMVDEARRRHAGAGFVVADAQVDELPGPFDQVVSRFGVMFFEDPVAAFANLRRAARPGARLTFVCWRGLAENPTMSVGSRRLIEAAPVPPPAFDPLAPGPLAFADPDRIRAVLAGGGWNGVEVARLDAVNRFDLEGSDGVEERLAIVMGSDGGRRFLEQVPEDQREAGLCAARADIESFLVQHPDGARVELAAACWLVTATN